MGAPRGGLRLVGWRKHDVGVTWLLTSACGPAPVDLVHRSTVDQTKGYGSLLIWAVGLRSEGHCVPRATRGGGTPACGGAGRRSSPEKPGIELPVAKHYGTRTKT
jgi:hypothetical protein